MQLSYQTNDVLCKWTEAFTLNIAQHLFGKRLFIQRNTKQPI